MDKINFENLPSTNTPLSASNLNTMQSNIEKSVVAVGSTQPSTGENVWIKKGKNLIDASKIMFGTVAAGTGAYSYLGYAAVTDYIYVGGGYYNYHLFNAGSGSNRIIIFRVVGYDANKGYLWDNSNLEVTDGTFNATTTKYVRICFAIYGFQGISSLDTIRNAQPQLEVGTTATTYEAYMPKKIYTKNVNDGFEEFYNEDNKENYFAGETKIGTWIDRYGFIQESYKIYR